MIRKLFSVVPFFYQNFKLFGNVMSPIKGSQFFKEKIPVDKHSFAFAVSGAVKNIGLHLGMPFKKYNQFMDNGIREFHGAIGVDIDDIGLRLDPF